jgi:hypothetical protein
MAVGFSQPPPKNLKNEKKNPAIFHFAVNSNSRLFTTGFDQQST